MIRMKIIFLTYLLLPLTLFCNNVSEETASFLALNFFAEKTNSARSINNSDLIVEPRFLENELVYYFVEVPNQGFMIVSGDQRCYPVPAYSFEPLDRVESMPQPAQEYLNWYASQILEVQRAGVKSSEKIDALWQHYLSEDFRPNKEKILSAGPLLTSQWGQKYYYNNMCPDDPEGPGGHAIAGCVATAVAQVMYYYRYPAQGEGSNGYMSDYGYEYVDFEEAEYLWDNMVNEVYGVVNPEVTQLIYHAGVAVEMDYGASSSGALTLEGAEALENYFRYDTSMIYISKYDTNISFKDSLIANLDQRLVILYRGGDLGGSHSFVCDGYQDSSYFHFNWGWNGSYDGYYMIENLNPNAYNFTFNQEAAINIYPRENYPEYCQGAKEFSISRGTFTDGSGPEPCQPNQTCSWLISPDEPGISNLQFWFTQFQMNQGYDVVSVYDGATTSDPLLGQFSGDDLPPFMVSSGAQLLVVSQTGGDVSDQGWNAEFLAYSGPFCEEESQFNNISRNYFTDGSGPYRYIDNSDCSWLIKPQGEDFDSIGNIYLYFHWTDMGVGDTLYVYDGGDNAAPLNGKFFGDQLPDTLHSVSNQVYLNFVSDNENNGDGWAAGYTSSYPTYCQDTALYTEKTAILEDGSGDYKYVPNSECYWLIETENTIVTTFEFLEFDLEYGYDQLKFYNAAFNPPVLFATYWGHEIPGLLEMNTDKVLIGFTSDVSSEYDGWKIKYTALAPGILESALAESIKLVPNPASAGVTIQGLNVDAEVSLYDINMHLLKKTSYRKEGNNLSLDVSDLKAGVYFISLETREQRIIKKLVIN